MHTLLANNHILRQRDERRMRDAWASEVRRQVLLRSHSHSDAPCIGDASSSSSSVSSVPVPVPSSPARPTHVSRSSDNIHFDSVAHVARSDSVPSPPPPFTAFHPTWNPVYSPHYATLVSPLLSMSAFLADLSILLASSPDNCTMLLTRWTSGMKMVMKELDWIGPTSTPQPHSATQSDTEHSGAATPSSNHLNVAAPLAVSVSSSPLPSPITVPGPLSPSASASVAAGLPPVVELESDSPVATDEERRIFEKLRAHPQSSSVLEIDMDVDAFLQQPSLHQQQQQHAGSIEEEILASQPIGATSHAPTSIDEEPYVIALRQQLLRADIDLESERTDSVANQLAHKVLETLLFHAVTQVREGWTHWRDTLVLLHLEAEQQHQILSDDALDVNRSTATATVTVTATEDRYRAIRRALLVGVFYKLESVTPPSAASATAHALTPPFQLLHHNLTHVVDLLEEALYFDPGSRLKQLRCRMVEGDAIDFTRKYSNRFETTSPSHASHSSATNNTSSSTDAWVLMEDDESSVSGSSVSGTDPFSSSHVHASTNAPTHPGFFRTEWPLVRAPLRALVHLRFSLQPVRFANVQANATGSNSVTQAMLSANEAALMGESSMTLSSSGNDLASLNSPTSSSSSSSSSSSGASCVPLRTGGPLRVIVRLLLDCCSAICLSTEHHGLGGRGRTGSVVDMEEMKDDTAVSGVGGVEEETSNKDASHPSSPKESSASASAPRLLTLLQDMVASLGALVHVELEIGDEMTLANANGSSLVTHDKSASREWKNRYVLHILWRLCQIMHILPITQKSGTNGDSSSPPAPTSPDLMYRVLHSTVEQIVESLKPFAPVAMSFFDTGSSSSAPSSSPHTPHADRVVYVPLVVGDEGFLDVDPTFQVPAAAPATVAANASPRTSTSPSPSSSPSPQSSSAASGDAGRPFYESPIYPRVMRTCNEYIAMSVQLFHSMEISFAASFLPEAERHERAMRKRLHDGELLAAAASVTGAVTSTSTGSGSSSSAPAKDTSRVSWRSVQTYSYAEVNRRAVADTFYTEHVGRIAEQWRTLAHALYSEGSAWCSSDIAHRPKFYCIDPVEDGYRMRRKIKVAWDAPDHHQASQS